MNILILNWRDTSHPLSGGAEIVTMEHAKRWVEAGHHVTWVTSGYKNAKRQESIHGVTIIRVGRSVTIHLCIPWFVLWNAWKYDIVVEEVHGIPFFSILCTKKPIIIFIHEIAGDIWDFMYPFPINKIGKFLESWCFSLYRRCLFWTDAPSTVDELVERGIQRDHCVAIPCPIVEPRTKNQEPRTKNLEPTYIFVSRVVRMKGIEEVIKAFSFIYREEPKSKLWIVGGGEETYIYELTRMIQEYGIAKNVLWLGTVSEKKKYEYMARAHILLHASVKEGWGLVILESACVGTPSIVYNVHGLQDVVKDGRTGVVLKENSPLEMAREAVRLYGDKKRYLFFQKNGKTRVNSLKWEQVVKQSVRLLQKAAEKKI